MNKFLQIIQNRNVILLTALALGLSVPKPAVFLKDSLIWVLAVVMLFSVSGINFKQLRNIKQAAGISARSIFMNYFIFGAILLSMSFLLFDDESIQTGFIVIAATPPGVAVIPFTAIFRGSMKFALIGILGSYLAAIILSPLIITIFTDAKSADPTRILETIAVVVVVPLILSRLLRLKKVYPTTEKIRGKITDIGFALIIYTSIGLNRDLLFSDFKILLYSSLIFIVSMFLTGLLYSFYFSNKISKAANISHNLMLTIKSSGFAAATAITLFDVKAAIPAAILSVFVLLYLLFADLWIPKQSPLNNLIFRRSKKFSFR
mgnify:CR=1 FL=1